MYLKSLVIKGFKSFADRTAVNFEPGISVIVGPNGSGKSNISEAVLWVLGERNPRNLRVQSLEELIFSGSSAREAVGVAEVDLVLDNSDNTLPIEFDQVSISRRMYRSGESEYFINKTPCRRRDIIDILYDSGIGGTVNSIISQGNLTAILESRPEDRHALLEDAAGILKHKKRKEAAGRKLDRMDATLERVGDIIRVIEQQLRPLERQAKRAEKYAEVKRELRDIDLALAVDELRSLQAEWNRLSGGIREIDAEAELANFRLSEREAELAKRQHALEEKGLFVGDINEQRIRVLSIIQRLDATMLLLEEKGRNMVARISDLRSTIYNSEARLGEAETELKQLALDFSAGEGRLAALYTSFNDLTRESEGITKNRREVETGYERVHAKLHSQESALAATRSNLTRTTESLSSLDLEEGLLKERAEQVAEELAACQELKVEREEAVRAAQQELQKLGREAGLSQNEIEKQLRLLDERKTRLEAKTTELINTRARLSSLEEVDRAMEAASPALNWAVENKARHRGIVGRLSDSLHVELGRTLPFGMRTEEMEGLVERLLGSDFFALLVADNDAGRELVVHLSELARSESKDGPANSALAILPLVGMSAPVQKSERGERLIDYLAYPPREYEAMAALLGDVYLVANVDEAIKNHLTDHTGARFITPDGQIVWPNGKLTVGFMLGDVDGVLERRRDIDRFTDDVELKSAEVADVELEVSETEQKLEEAQGASLDIAQLEAKAQAGLESAEQELERLEKTLHQLELRETEAARKLQDVARRRDVAAPLAGEYSERIAVLETDIERLTEEAERASKQLLAATEEKNAISERLTECKIDLEANKGTQAHLTSRMKALETLMAGLSTTVEVSAQTAGSLDLIHLRIDPLYKLYQELHAGASSWAERLHDQALLEQTDSANLREIINEATEAAQDARDALAEINERRTAVLVEQGKLESSVQHAMQRIISEHETSLEAALELPSVEDRVSAEERACRLRSQIANLGAINQVAMEEYAALRGRRDYMNEQIADLTEARKSLAKISQALDKKMRNQFLETFNRVNMNFQEIIGILFPGGRGELILTQGDDPDQQGIEVSAQPEGKRILKLSMMSGGEKSLVALTLMFAVYSIRKVPFYVLDEVDAALDDTNLLRLLDYLNHLRTDTQLIMVSHQRRTMETADILYGVTMQAAGVSKLVSQRLDQAMGYASQDVAGNESGEQAAAEQAVEESAAEEQDAKPAAASSDAKDSAASPTKAKKGR
ncbi:MAG: chromosome segregation protein SMC [Coriobacteriales bacterium]|jgi:chromosome segregation protein|nr:chromosome segregation protein SMC [Coriobacteriales bacterium]